MGAPEVFWTASGALFLFDLVKKINLFSRALGIVGSVFIKVRALNGLVQGYNRLVFVSARACSTKYVQMHRALPVDSVHGALKRALVIVHLCT